MSKHDLTIVALRHFHVSEFDSPDQPGSGKHMHPTTLRMLDEAREIADTPFRITSGYRTKQRNKRVGGVADSSHLDGWAVDIACTNSIQRLKIVQALLQVGFNRIGVARTFIHADNDPSKRAAMWTYNNR